MALGMVGLIAACSPPHPVLLSPSEAYGTKPAYNYPISDPYAATIIALPPDMKVDYSSLPKPQDKKIVLFQDRLIPEGLWYQRGLKYSEMLQERPAPLVYIISGTGADSHASIMRTLGNILYAAGYSVVFSPSPTNPNFIINASETFLPGNPEQDAHDLYRLMQAIDSKVSEETSITGRMLMGYSLGAWEAAFTAHLDSQLQHLNFSKVLLINPPLSLYSSMKILDDDLNRDLPHGMNDASGFVKRVITRMSKSRHGEETFDFTNENLLLDYYNKYHPSDAQLASVIGLSFRLSAADMIFTSDVMRHGGYIFPKNKEFTTSTDLNLYLALALRTGFSNYLNDVFYEAQHKQRPAVTKHDLIEASSLEALNAYLLHNDKFGIITNQDDIILGEGDLTTLIGLFSSHVIVFPSGGHLGNIALPAMAYQILAFMKQGSP